MILGHVRVSTDHQSLDGQHDFWEKAGAGRLPADTITGTARHRPELDCDLDQFRPGEVPIARVRTWNPPAGGAGQGGSHQIFRLPVGQG